jgi:single-strand DNA-binding protein
MAKDLNQVIIIGRLVRDPEIKYTTAGTPVTKFSIANNAGFTQNNEKKDVVNYFDVVVWGNQAENCEKYLKKGSQAAIEGHLRQNRWTDQATGKTLSKVEINANSVQFLTPALGGQKFDSAPQQQQQYQQQNNFSNSKPVQQQQKETSNFNPNPWNDSSSYNDGNTEDPFAQSEQPIDDDIPF